MNRIDWDAVRRTLDWEQSHEADVLESRTAKYARPAAGASADSEPDALHILTFTRAQERYAVPVAFVQIGLVQTPITPLPGVPAYYVGVINVRGQMRSVLDLRRFWGLPAVPPAEPQLVVTTMHDLTLALLADAVETVTTVPLAAIIPPAAAGVGMTHIQGVTHTGLVILDMESLGTDSRLIIDRPV